MVPTPHCLKLFKQTEFLTRFCALLKTGRSIEKRTDITAITVNNSTRVNPCFIFVMKTSFYYQFRNGIDKKDNKQVLKAASTKIYNLI
jgi:hypothetical protein